jgi:tape measure domain-containing protein
MDKGAKVGAIYWEADLDNTKVVKGVQETSNVVKSLNSPTNTATASVATLAKGFLAAGSAVLVFKKALDITKQGLAAAGEIESAQMGFKTLLNSVDDAAAAIKMIQKDALETPFDAAGLIKYNQQLTSVTKNATQSEGILLNVGKALSAAGKSTDALGNVILNLQQIGNTGKITEMDIRQFGSAGINVLEVLADYYGVTKDKASEMVKDSKNAFEDLEKAFEKAGTGSGKFANAFKDQAGTYQTAVSNLKDTWSQSLAKIVQDAGLFDFVKQAIIGVTDSIGTIATAMTFVLRVIESVVVIAVQLIRNLGTAIAVVMASVINLFRGGVSGFVDTLKKGGEMMAGNVETTVNTIGKIWGSGNDKKANDSKSTDKEILDSSDNLTSEQIKNIEKENYAFEKANAKRLKSFKESLSDMIFAHKEKVASIEDDIDDENESYLEKIEDRTKSFNESLADMIKAHAKKVATIKQQVLDETESTKKANDEILADLNDEKLDEKETHDKTVRDLQAKIDHEIALGKNGSKSKIKSLQEQISTENEEYDKKISKLEKSANKEIIDNNEKLDEKLTDLQKELAEENADFDEQKAKLEADNIDTTAKLKKEHDKRLADYQKTLDDEMAILKLHQSDVDALKDKAKEDDITRLKRQYVEENAEALADHNKKLADIKDQKSTQGSTAGASFGSGLNSEKGGIENTSNSIVNGLFNGAKDSADSKGKDTIKNFLNGILGKIKGLASGVKDWFVKILGSDFFQTPMYMANGTRNWKGGSAIIGELGPELVQLPAGANVYSNKETKKMLGGQGNQDVRIYIDKVRDFQDVEAIGRELGFKANLQPR